MTASVRYAIASASATSSEAVKSGMPNGVPRKRDHRPRRGQQFGSAPATIAVTSPAFRRDEPIPSRHTADGAGLSPPIAWQGLPAGTAAAVLVVEDADSPTPEPLVHAMVLDLPGRDGAMAVGALKSPAGAGEPHRLG